MHINTTLKRVNRPLEYEKQNAKHTQMLELDYSRIHGR